MHALFFVLAGVLTWKLIRIARWRRYHGHHGHHHGGLGRRGWHRGGGFLHHRLDRLFDALDTTAEQEKVIREAIAEVRTTARDGRGEWKDARVDLAELLREPAFDEATLDRAWARHDAFFGKLRVSVGHALARVHEALDERQRARLADFLGGDLPRSLRFGAGVYR